MDGIGGLAGGGRRPWRPPSSFSWSSPGTASPFPVLVLVDWFRGIGEYKIDWGPGYRVYLAKAGKTIIILLGGGTKKRQQKDIDRAVKLLESYKRRKEK